MTQTWTPSCCRYFPGSATRYLTLISPPVFVSPSGNSGTKSHNAVAFAGIVTVWAREAMPCAAFASALT